MTLDQIKKELLKIGVKQIQAAILRGQTDYEPFEEYAIRCFIKKQLGIHTDGNPSIYGYNIENVLDKYTLDQLKTPEFVLEFIQIYKDLIDKTEKLFMTETGHKLNYV